MTLQVPFSAFAETVRRVLPGAEVYVTRYPGGSVATAADPLRQTMVASPCRCTPEAAIKQLEEENLAVFEGTWFSADVADLSREAEDAFIAGVAYQSGDGQAGLWMDAYSHVPTQVQVLRAMFDELRSTGELSEVSFEEFVRLAKPTVVIISPSDVRSFITQKEAIGDALALG